PGARTTGAPAGNIRLLAALTLAPGPTSIALTATSLRTPTSVAPSMLVISMNTSVAPPFPAGRAQGKLTTNIAAAMAGANASINPAIRAIILGMGVWMTWVCGRQGDPNSGDNARRARNFRRLE